VLNTLGRVSSDRAAANVRSAYQLMRQVVVIGKSSRIRDVRAEGAIFQATYGTEHAQCQLAITLCHRLICFPLIKANESTSSSCCANEPARTYFVAAMNLVHSLS